MHLTGNSKEKADNAWEKAQDVKKTDFALQYAVDSVDWLVPKYIKEGILWLADLNDPSPDNGGGHTKTSDALLAEVLNA